METTIYLVKELGVILHTKKRKLSWNEVSQKYHVRSTAPATFFNLLYEGDDIEAALSVLLERVAEPKEGMNQ